MFADKNTAGIAYVVGDFLRVGAHDLHMLSRYVIGDTTAICQIVR